MTFDETLAHLRVSLSVILDRELPDFSASTKLLEDLGMDSFGFVELLMSLEDTLGLEADPDTMAPEVFDTAGTLAEYVCSQLDPAPAAAELAG